MWYFTWVLGLGFACAFSILNALWLEVAAQRAEEVPRPGEPLPSHMRERS